MNFNNYQRVNAALLIFSTFNLIAMNQPASLQYQAAKFIVGHALDTQQLNQPCKKYVSILKQPHYFLQAKASIILNTDHIFEIIPDQYRTLKTDKQKEVFNATIKKLTEYAVLFGNKEALQLLLEYDRNNANLIIDKNRHSLLVYAAHKPEDIEIAKLLLQYGADPIAEDVLGQTALIHAANANNIELMERLLQEKHELFYISAALNFAARSNAQEAALYLLQKGANPNFPIIEPFSTLSQAITNNNRYLIEKLLEYGAQLGSSIHHLTSAIKVRNTELLQWLCNKNIDTNLTDNEGNTAIFYGVKEPDPIPVLKILLNARANINHQNNYGETILHIAASKGNLELIQFLCDNKANIKAETHSGKQPIDMAVVDWHKEVVNYLLKIHQKDGSLSCLRRLMHKTTCYLLPLSGHFPDKKNNDTFNKEIDFRNFIVAIQADDLEKVKAYLSDRYIQERIYNLYGSTMVHHAAGYKSLKVLQFALQYGNYLHKKNQYGMTPLMAARFAQPNNEVESLIKEAMRADILKKLT